MAREPTDGGLLRDYLQKRLDDQDAKERMQREGIRQKTKKHKKEKLASLQVFLDKELVRRFKEETKVCGYSQAEILKSMIMGYLESHGIPARTD